MKEDQLLKSWFESARNERPKVSFEEVAETFQTSISWSWLDKVKELLINKINLNTILMISTGSILITLAALVFLPSENHNDVITEVKTKPISSENFSIEEEKTIASNTTFTKKEINETALNIDLKSKTFSTSKTENKVALPEAISLENQTSFISYNNQLTEQPIDLTPFTTKDIKNDLPEKNNDVPIVTPKNSKSIISVKSASNHQDPYAKELKMLRRELMRNLAKDKIVRTKRSKVVMEIPEGKIIVNDKVIPKDLMMKYMYILQNHAVKPKENRQIRIEEKYIMVGDMTKDGFTGVGIGGGSEVYYKNFIGEMEIAAEGFKATIHPSELPQADEKGVSENLNNKLWIEKSVKTPEQKNIEAMLQIALNQEQFDRFLEKDQDGISLPMTILSNRHFSENIEITRQGKKARIFASRPIPGLEDSKAFLDIKKLKIKRNKAKLEFKYLNNYVVIKMAKSYQTWEWRFLSIKNGSGKYVVVNF